MAGPSGGSKVGVGWGRSGTCETPRVTDLSSTSRRNRRLNFCSIQPAYTYRSIFSAIFQKPSDELFNRDPQKPPHGSATFYLAGLLVG